MRTDPGVVVAVVVVLVCALVAVTLVVMAGGVPSPHPQRSKEPTRTQASATGASAGRLDELVVAEPSFGEDYDRDAFGGWVDADGDCLDTRAEVLVASSEAPVVMDGCRVASGRWTDPYSGAVTGVASELDVDHTVALANAWRSGAWRWPSRRLVDFANELAAPGHLVAIPASENREKSDDGPQDWRPPDEAAWCGYARTWVKIKARWSLSVSPVERDALVEMLASC